MRFDRVLTRVLAGRDHDPPCTSPPEVLSSLVARRCRLDQVGGRPGVGRGLKMSPGRLSPERSWGASVGSSPHLIGTDSRVTREDRTGPDPTPPPPQRKIKSGPLPLGAGPPRRGPRRGS